MNNQGNVIKLKKYMIYTLQGVGNCAGRQELFFLVWGKTIETKAKALLDGAERARKIRSPY